MNGFLLSALLAVAVSSPARSANELCLRINILETAKVEASDDPAERRWVEFHWGVDDDADAIWSWGCRNSNHRIAKATCDWLMENTNQEFSMMLPQAVMKCYGYRFPKYAFYDWDGIKGAIELRSEGGRRLSLDLNYRDLAEGEVAMRLAIEDRGKGEKYEPNELPPIQSMRAATASR